MTVTCYVNDCAQANIKVDTKIPLYGIVGIFGQVTCVNIVDSDVLFTTMKFAAIGSYLERMRNAVEALKVRTRDGVPEVKQKLSSDLLNTCFKLRKEGLLRLGAEKLVEMGALQLLMDYLIFLRSFDYERDEVVQVTYKSVLRVCFNYCDDSPPLSKKLGEVGLLDLLIKELNNISECYRFSSVGVEHALLYFGILHNCAKATENKSIFQRNEFLKVAKPYCDTKSNYKEIPLADFFLLNRTCFKKIK